jgi:hypothetical protein
MKGCNWMAIIELDKKYHVYDLLYSTDPPPEPDSEIIDWLNQHCPARWHVRHTENWWELFLVFDNDDDAFLFKMVWC